MSFSPFDRMRLAAIAGVFCAALAAVPAVGAAPSVQERLDNIERKLDARGLIDMHNRIDLVKYALRTGLIELDE